MKRDWDMIRELLIEAVEAGPGKVITLHADVSDFRPGQKKLDPVADNEQNRKVYNAFLLKEMGFVHGHVLANPMTRNLPRQVMITDVTPEGHDFFQNSMQKKPVWEKVKAVLLATGVTGGTEAIKLTTKLVVEQLKENIVS